MLGLGGRFLVVGDLVVGWFGTEFVSFRLVVVWRVVFWWCGCGWVWMLVILVLVLLLVVGEFWYCGWYNMVDVLGTVSECCVWGVCG